MTYLINDYLYSIGNLTGLSIGIIGIVGGLFVLLLGYKIKKIALAVVGFFTGYTLGTFLAERLVDSSTVLFSLLPVLIGIGTAVLMFAVYKFALYIMGIAVGAIAGFYLAEHLLNQPLWGLAIAAGGGLIIGSIALKAERPIVILATAFIGYIAFRQGLYAVISVNESIVIEIICLALLVLGIVIQFLTNRKQKGSSSRPVEEEYPVSE